MLMIVAIIFAVILLGILQYYYSKHYFEASKWRKRIATVMVMRRDYHNYDINGTETSFYNLILADPTNMTKYVKNVPDYEFFSFKEGEWVELIIWELVSKRGNILCQEYEIGKRTGQVELVPPVDLDVFFDIKNNKDDFHSGKFIICITAVALVADIFWIFFMSPLWPF